MNKKKSLFESLKIGLGGGFLASLCCFGPLILVFLGLSSISFAIGISKFRPYFITLSVIFLIFAIYFYIKKKEGVCSRKTLKRNWIEILSAIFFAILIWYVLVWVITPFIAPYIYK